MHRSGFGALPDVLRWDGVTLVRGRVRGCQGPGRCRCPGLRGWRWGHGLRGADHGLVEAERVWGVGAFASPGGEGVLPL